MENNILILFLSPYNIDRPCCYKYDGDDGIVYKGVLSNEAASKYLIRHSNENGMPINNVIVIASNEVRRIIDTLNKKTYDLYQENINRYIKEYNYQKVIYYRIDYNENNQNKSGELSLLLDAIDAKLDSIRGDTKNIFIDQTGGLRDITFFLIALIRYFEIKGMQVRDIAYGKLGNTNVVESIHDYFTMFDIISAVDEFTKTGRVEALLNIPGVKDDKAFFKILETVDVFVKNIEINSMDDIEGNIRDVGKAVNEYDTALLQKKYTYAWREFVPIIKDDMHLDEVLNSPGGKINYPQLIGWCIEHNYIQQALVLYVEKLPKYYVDNVEEIKDFICCDFIEWEKDKKNIKKNKEEEYHNFFYKKLLFDESVSVDSAAKKSIYNELILNNNFDNFELIVNSYKKCLTLEKLKGIISVDFYDKLLYYLALCFIRNKIFHSDESSPMNLFQCAEITSYFKERDIYKVSEGAYLIDDIKGILSDGIKAATIQ